MTQNHYSNKLNKINCLDINKKGFSKNEEFFSWVIVPLSLKSNSSYNFILSCLETKINKLIQIL